MHQQLWIVLVCSLLATACERRDMSPKPSVVDAVPMSLAVFDELGYGLSYSRGEYLLLEQ